LSFDPTFCIDEIVPAFPVSDKKVRALRNRLAALQCFEQDLEESFFRGSGVDLRHRSTGIRIRCCRESSQALNRFLARRLLADELEARLQNKTRYEVKAEKIREAKGKRSMSGVSDKLRQYVLRPIEREND
jgi:protein subunit release factor B